jgi:hypothetical protein
MGLLSVIFSTSLQLSVCASVMSFGQNFASPGQAKLEFPGCLGAICLVQSENVLEVEYTNRDWRGNGFSGQNGSRKNGRTTTDWISKTYKDSERLSPIVLVEHIDDLLVPK